MPIYTDQTGHSIALNAIPRRIVSLVPSQTELLQHLGLNDEVLGITKFCVHPKQWFQSKTIIGGTKSVHIEKILALQPDLIIANKEENTKDQVAQLAALCPVWTSNISSLQDALQMIETIGSITACSKKAAALIQKINTRFDLLRAASEKIRAAYLIWQQPYMTVGGDTFINDMLNRCGFKNIFADLQRYPSTSLDEIRNRRCQLLLLSSEPFPFKEKHIEALQQQLPSVKILLADGEMFSWYGSRLLLAPAYFESLIKAVR